MSTDTIATSTSHRPQQDGGAAAGRPVTLPRVINSEWIKFRTLRSTRWVLALTVLAMVVLSLVIGFNTRHLTGNQDPNDLVPSATLQGYYLAQLLIGALGVLSVSGEFGTGMIRSTFAAVPRRLPAFWAKLIVFVAVTAVSMIATSVVAFVASQALIGHYRTAFSLASPGALHVVLGTGVYLTLVGVIGMMIGWVVRSTPGSLVGFATLLLILPVVLGNFLQHWGAEVSQYLPTQAGASFASNLPDSPHLSAWAGFGVLAAWVVGSILLALVTLRRRDA